MRLLHTMLRVSDLERSLRFYCETLGMTLFCRETYSEGRFTLAFVGYGDEQNHSVIELTHNWDTDHYERGNGYGHIAIGVADAAQTIAALRAKGVKIVREAGPMSNTSPERAASGLAPEIIAFVEDPDGYRVELIQCP
jgi:lactoylglutathione lyase